MASTGILIAPTFSAVGDKTYEFDYVAFQTLTDPNGDAFTNLSADDNLLYVAAADAFTFLPVPGVVQRYDVLSLTLNMESNTVAGTIRLDNGDAPEVFQPLSGGDCAVGIVTGQNMAGVAPSEALYPSLGGGFYTAAMANEMVRIGNLQASSRPAKLIDVTLTGPKPAGSPLAYTLPAGYTPLSAIFNGVLYAQPEVVFSAGAVALVEFESDASCSLRVLAV